ncbi:STAS domain-containing protein [Thiomicrospira sp. R3]|uniref:STAS domain-containing protein n=1 Tax=Thiomicrospira sp. R3 TaxID=3035472 RepID=UPI00259B1DDE|nr:STAS domain-containing protein [Thiomicrospira sp. R3]WFE68888.1 STAS domain-containing protein [Thiomicrospira sp. R3]
MSPYFEFSAAKLVFTTDLVLPQISKLHSELRKSSLSELKQVDLSGVKALDSAGIALLLELQQGKNCPLVLLSPPAHLITMLELYNLDNQFELVKRAS